MGVGVVERVNEEEQGNTFNNKFKKRNKKGTINSCGSSGQESLTKAGWLARGFRNCPTITWLLSGHSLSLRYEKDKGSVHAASVISAKSLLVWAPACERLRGTRGWTPELGWLQSSGKSLTSWVPQSPHLSRGDNNCDCFPGTFVRIGVVLEAQEGLPIPAVVRTIIPSALLFLNMTRSEFSGPQVPCFHLWLHLWTCLNEKVATALSGEDWGKGKTVLPCATCDRNKIRWEEVGWWLRDTDFSTSPAMLDTSASLFAPVSLSPKGVIWSRWSKGFLSELTFFTVVWFSLRCD